MIKLPGGFLGPLCAKQPRNRDWFSLRCIFPSVWPLQALHALRCEWREAVRSALLGAQPNCSWCCGLAYLTAAQLLYSRASPLGGTFRTVNSHQPTVRAQSIYQTWRLISSILFSECTDWNVAKIMHKEYLKLIHELVLWFIMTFHDFTSFLQYNVCRSGIFSWII